AGARALQYIAGVGEVVLERAGKVGMAGSRTGDGLVLLRVAFTNRKDLFPVLPVAVGERHGDRRADGLAVAHTRQDMRRIALNAHAATTAVTLLAAPEFVIEKGLVDRHTRRETADKGYERFAVTFAGCRKTKHELSIITRWREAYSGSSKNAFESNSGRSIDRTQSVTSPLPLPAAFAAANSPRMAWNFASRSSSALSSIASGVIGSLGEPNSSFPWCARIMCSTTRRSLSGKTSPPAALRAAIFSCSKPCAILMCPMSWPSSV